MPTPAKLNPTECYDLRVKGYTLKDIADEKGVSIEAVSKAVQKVTHSDLYKMGLYSVETFLQTFSRAEQYFDSQVRDYQKLIVEVQSMKPANDKDKRAKIDLIRKIMESQSKAVENIVVNAKQGEVLLAIQLVRDVLKKHAPAKPLIITRIDEVREEPDVQPPTT